MPADNSGGSERFYTALPVRLASFKTHRRVKRVNNRPFLQPTLVSLYRLKPRMRRKRPCGGDALGMLRRVARLVLRRRYRFGKMAVPNDPIGGTIGSAQFEQWRVHFGDMFGSGSALGPPAQSNVSEPNFLLMLSAGGMLLAVAAGRGRHRSRICVLADRVD